MNVIFENYIRDTLEAKEMRGAFEYILDQLKDDADKLDLNQYIKTCDIDMLREWEIYLGIDEDKTLSLEDRRAVVLLKLFAKPPYTMNNVKKQIFSIVGEEINVSFDYSQMKLSVDLTNATSLAQSMTSLYLKQVKPCNVWVELITSKDIDNTHRFYNVISRMVHRDI